MNDYQGMRWFKCDLQVQTPEDGRHWQDADLRLGDPRRPQVGGVPEEIGIQEKARRFLARCHELGLEAIAITDHNFSAKCEPRDWFLTHLIEQNRTVAKDCERGPLAIFPGFEVDIGYHVLCLFAPAKKQRHVQRVSMVLTKLGLAENDRFKNGVPQPLRFNDRPVNLKTLLEVVQGEHEGIVIAAHADQKDGIFENTRNIGDFQLLDLHCVELTRYPPAEKVAAILSGNNREWSRRTRSPAVVQSSDAKSLQVGKDGKPAGNALGYRHTWIKMSKPSIEGLRQAFLDPESRSRLPEDIATDVNPAQRQRHARILFLGISGAEYVTDQGVRFSPNLNCIIGGRGSGKSTLLEYLRLGLRKDQGDDVRDDRRTLKKIERIRKTIGDPLSEIRIRWKSRDGVEDTLVFDAAGGARVDGREVLDPDTFYRGLAVRFFSQQQLTQLTEKEGNNLLPLIDDFVRADLDELEATERELRAEISRLFEVRRQQVVLQGERKRLAQEVAELNRQRTARAGLQVAAETHERLQAESKVIERLQAAAQQPNAWVELAEDFVESHSPLGSLADDWPHGVWLQALDAKLEQSKQSLVDAIKAAVNAYQQEITDLFAKNTDWPAIKQQIDRADTDFLAACTAQGLTPDEVNRIKEIDRSLRTKRLELDSKERKLDDLVKELAPLEAKQEALLGVWLEQFELREQAARQAGERSASSAAKFLAISVRYSGDRTAFNAIWERLAPRDGRTALARTWDAVGEALFAHTEETRAASPWTCLETMLADPEEAPSEIGDWIDPLTQHLHSDAVKTQWEEVQLLRVPDLIDLTLFREDGTRAGSVQEGGLSDGQRNTAALALLLAQGNGPLIIDQPEDELDSSFIYRDLVPMLRSMKERRQLIFATHNANLPVNGDAELVYALESQSGRGHPRAQGGLDLPEVSEAVLDVMEGSKEAFQKRREKYHF